MRMNTGYTLKGGVVDAPLPRSEILQPVSLGGNDLPKPHAPALFPIRSLFGRSGRGPVRPLRIGIASLWQDTGKSAQDGRGAKLRSAVGRLVHVERMAKRSRSSACTWRFTG